MSLTNKYRQKPVKPPISGEVVQLSIENAAEVAKWVGGRPHELGILIPSLEGEPIQAVFGEYVIKDEEGFSAYDAEQFEANFDIIGKRGPSKPKDGEETDVSTPDL